MRELSLNILDIVQNSISAGSSLTTVTILESSAADRLIIEIADCGCGMTEEQVRHVTDPFFTTRTTRKVGMGVPLFKMAAEMTGGSFSIDSKVGEGTLVRAEFIPSSIDMIPLGDINATISILIRMNPNLDFIYKRKINEQEFILDTRELRETLGEEIPLDNADVMQWIDEFLKENTNELFSGGAQI